jgi:hypothetical protein
MGLLDDVATYLDSSTTTGLSVLSGTSGNLVKSYWPPDSPDTLVGLFETAGSGSFFEFSTSTAGASRVYTVPALQCLSRSLSAVTAKANADIVFDVLDGFIGTMSTSTGANHYVQIVADQAPFQADRDANQRFVYSVNFTVWASQ